MKNCTHCGKPLMKDARYCAYCGKPTDLITRITNDKDLDVGNRVILCNDGKYRWIYELHLLKNLTIFWDVLVVLGMSAFIVLILNLVIELFEDGLSLDMFIWLGELLLIVGGILTVVSFLGYFLYAAINGWHYVAMFEMDEEGVVHRQMGKSVKTAKAIGWISVLAGIATKNAGTIGRGITSATKTSLASSYDSVRKLIPVRRNNVIKVHELLTRNRVYVKDEDFDFVYEYIRSRCPRLNQENNEEKLPVKD